MTSSQNENAHLICECKNNNDKVSKAIASSFITIIEDIKRKNPEWIIIPVFASNNGFQSGASKILNEFNIISFYLNDISKSKTKLEITETHQLYDIKINKVYLNDGTLVSNNSKFRNLQVGETLSVINWLNYFKCYDENGNKIEYLGDHLGYFKAEGRKNVEDVCDKFVLVGDKANRELSKIEGFNNGVLKNEQEETYSVEITSIYKGMLTIDRDDDNKILVYKDNTLIKENSLYFNKNIENNKSSK